MSPEFPNNPTKSQLRRQQEVATVISGMQDIALEVIVTPVVEPPNTDSDYDWQKYLDATTDIRDGSV